MECWLHGESVRKSRLECDGAMLFDSLLGSLMLQGVREQAVGRTYIYDWRFESSDFRIEMCHLGFQVRKKTWTFSIAFSRCSDRENTVFSLVRYAERDE
jgi:hypothetical protein